ncbi:MAG: GNAT family N-acetyltransferase [Bacteroidales bacterium]|nr:GNAT family N-acetyltransferase [Bacteroidales bacterium]
MIIKGFHDFETSELYAIFRHIYITSEFMSDDFDRKFHTVHQFHNHYHEILRQPGAFLLVAMMDEKPAGYLVLEPNPATKLAHTAWLNMGIVDHFRRQGIGIRLVEGAIKRMADEKKIEIIYLMVRKDNTAALQLYKKTGFDIVAQLEKDTKIGYDYYDGIMMRRFV